MEAIRAFFGSLLFFACTDGRVREQRNDADHPSVNIARRVESPAIVYAPVVFDTARNERSVPIGNGMYPLHIISYSLNDSSIMNGDSISKYIDHDHAFKVVLEGHSGSDLSIVLNKRTFRDSLAADFFQRAGLYLVDYASVRSNAIYLDAFIGVPETDHVHQFQVQ